MTNDRWEIVVHDSSHSVRRLAVPTGWIYQLQGDGCAWGPVAFVPHAASAQISAVGGSDDDDSELRIDAESLRLSAGDASRESDAFEVKRAVGSLDPWSIDACVEHLDHALDAARAIQRRIKR